MRAARSSRYAFTSRTQLEIGSKSRSFLTVIPYSISVPITLGIAIAAPLGPGRREIVWEPSLQVLTGVDVLDRPFLPADARDQGADVDDALALAARDPGPVVGVRRVREILVLLELVPDGLLEVLQHDPALAVIDEALDGHLLRARHDVLDHRAAREVLEVEDLALSLGVGDLEEF